MAQEDTSPTAAGPGAIRVCWERTPPHDRRVILRALGETDLLEAARRLLGRRAPSERERLEVAFVAQGGAMRVYRLTLRDDRAAAVVLKLPRSRFLAHRPMRELAFPEPLDGDHDEALMRAIVETARRLNRAAPELYPQLGGYWRWQEGGLPVRVLLEEFVAGRALDQHKRDLEQDFLSGRLDYASLQQSLLSLERRGLGAYLRLWDALERKSLTLDPTPWNVVQREGRTGALTETILDLHHLTGRADPTFVMQRLLAGFGMRDETVKQALLPAYIDTFGEDEGRRLLRTIADELAHQEAGRTLAGLRLYERVRAAILEFLAGG